jgi:outer membrane protein TolC
LVAQASYSQAKLAVIVAHANRLADCAALFQALGGGWWNRSADIAAGATQPKLEN